MVRIKKWQFVENYGKFDKNRPYTELFTFFSTNCSILKRRGRSNKKSSCFFFYSWMTLIFTSTKDMYIVLKHSTKTSNSFFRVDYICWNTKGNAKKEDTKNLIAMPKIADTILPINVQRVKKQHSFNPHNREICCGDSKQGKKKLLVLTRWRWKHFMQEENESS